MKVEDACISQEECKRIDVGFESNNCWLLFVFTFPITNNIKKKGGSVK